jgi:hypothetical protein
MAREGLARRKTTARKLMQQVSISYFFYKSFHHAISPAPFRNLMQKSANKLEKASP